MGVWLSQPGKECGEVTHLDFRYWAEASIPKSFSRHLKFPSPYITAVPVAIARNNKIHIK